MSLNLKLARGILLFATKSTNQYKKLNDILKLRGKLESRN